MPELRKTTCNRDCPDACSIVATVEDGKVVKLGGDPDHPVTRGFLCYRTNHFLTRQYAPDRLMTPLWRQSLDDEFQPIGWDQALDIAAERLQQIRRESGPAAIFHYRSGGSLGLLKHLTDYFFEQFGPTTIKRGDICSGAGDHAQTTDFGDEDANELSGLLDARHILLWGKNVFVSSPHTIPLLNDARERGAELVLIDPVHHRTASLCQAYVQPRPGSDLVLALAVARILFERGWADGSRCDNVDEFHALAFARTVEEACAEADVEPSVAHDLARRLHERPCAILVGWGMGRRVNGSAIVRVLDALCALSGNLGIRGGGVTFYFKRRGAFDTSFIRGSKVAPRTLCEPLFGQEVLEASDPPVRAVWITAGNPVTMLPDSHRSARALRSREFVVVVDAFMTDTAKLAHLVLPTTTLLEADDILGAYGHHYVGVARPVVPPPPGVRSDLEIVQALANRVGLGEVLAGSPREWKQRMISKAAADQGLRIDDLERGAARNPIAKPLFAEGGRVATPSGKVNLITAMPRVEPPAPGLFLMALSTDKAQCSQWAKPHDGPPVVTVHPDAAADIRDGGLGRLVSAIGALDVRVKHDARQRRDVALMAKGGHLGAGQCANVLIRARLTDGGEGAALYDERVRLEPAA